MAVKIIDLSKKSIGNAMKDSIDKFSRMKHAFDEKAEREIVRKAAEPVVRRASQDAARRTGALSESIGIVTRKERVIDEIKSVSARVGAKGDTFFRDGKGGVKRFEMLRDKKGRYTGVKRSISGYKKSQIVRPIRYIHLVELGTKHSSKKPFLEPALEKMRPVVEAIIEREAKKEIERWM